MATNKLLVVPAQELGPGYLQRDEQESSELQRGDELRKIYKL